MPLRLDRREAGFEERFAALLAGKREAAEDIDSAVSGIISEVRQRGDDALIDFTRRYDQVDLERDGIAVTAATMAAAEASADQRTVRALELAAERIQSYHARQLPIDDRYVDAVGVELGVRWTAIESAGIYVPGGTASYPSSVLMNAIPAQVAGVPRVAMVVPMPQGVFNPLVLVAARIAGVSEIYRIGGAQAIAALAYGTASVPPVAKIVGPGNAYVAAAKRRVFGTVGIDMIAGPSEVLIIADADTDPSWIAADLLAQAEHDASAQSILLTADAAFADAVAAEVERQLIDLPRREIAARSWRDYGAIILVRSLDEAPALVDRIAPEHLQITTADAEAIAERVRNAGAIFLGAHTPEVIGDYVGGTNHVLPTARSARFASGLGVLDFMKRTSTLKLGATSLASLGPAAMALAEAEGLAAHRRSVAIRLMPRGGGTT
jgi:histidinol dehydrogenase